MDIRLGVVCGIGALAFWAIGNIFGAKAVQKTSPLRVAFTGQLIGLVMLWFVGIFGSPWSAMNTAEWALIILIGVLSVPIYWALYSAFQHGKLAVVVPISASYSLITIALAMLFLGERFARAEWAAVLLVILGTVVLAGKWNERTQKRDWLSPGAGFALLVAALWGVQFALIGLLVQTVHWLQATMLAQTVTVIGLAAFVFVREGELFPRGNVIYLAAGAGLTEAFAFLLYHLGVSLDSVSIVAPIAAATPLVTVPLAALFLSERPTLVQLFAGIATVIGIVVLAL
jgi:transporter family protein